MRQIINKLCQKNNISLQKLAVKINLPLSLIYSYIHENYPIDNYYLNIILNYFDFDLYKYIDTINEN